MEEFIGFRLTHQERELLKAAARSVPTTETQIVRDGALQHARELLDAQRSPELQAAQ